MTFRALVYDGGRQPDNKSRQPYEKSRWRRFHEPLSIIAATSPGEVADALRAAEAEALRGRCLVGFVCYEAASGLDPALTHHEPGELPLVCFGVFDRDPSSSQTTSEGASAPDAAPVGIRMKPQLSCREYAESIRRIKNHLANGDTYQVNFTHQMTGQAPDDLPGLFAGMAAAQASEYAVHIETGEFAVLSVSPELFFERRGRRIRTEPMKGTRPRGRFPAEDEQLRRELASSEKDRAENLMIVDMMRNDLGRVAMPGSVKPDGLFRLKRLPTLWQQVSGVSAESDATLEEIFRALFPCASVTGAPKVRTMEIIRELETEPRGVYTGAIGVIRPGGDARFSVAIRTLTVHKRTGRGSYGVGGGIVQDSEPLAEWREALAKSAVLGFRRPGFRLVETMRHDPREGIANLQLHLARLRRSADFFGFALDEAALTACLGDVSGDVSGDVADDVAGGVSGDVADDVSGGAPERLRLLLAPDGGLSLERRNLQREELPGAREPVRLQLAAGPVDAGDVFLFHKTTHRQVYESARAACAHADDVILFNQRGELTETTIFNLYLEMNGELLTPPVTCGLLAGVHRHRLLAEGRAHEAILRVEDLERADRLFVSNSVRGLLEARLLSDCPAPGRGRGPRRR